MKNSKRQKLEAAGWKVGSAADFLGLSKEEELLIEMKLALANKLKASRQERKTDAVRNRQTARVKSIPNCKNGSRRQVGVARSARPFPSISGRDPSRYRRHDWHTRHEEKRHPPCNKETCGDGLVTSPIEINGPHRQSFARL